MDFEIVICRNCGTELHVPSGGDLECPQCHELCMSKPAIMRRVKVLQAKRDALTNEIGLLNTELILRKQRHRETWFWETPKASLKVPVKRPEPVVNLDDFC